MLNVLAEQLSCWQSLRLFAKFAGFATLGWEGIVAIVLILVIVRPANVFLSTIRSNLDMREKLFLSWLNPRGIIAASMASLFALIMVQQTNSPYSE